MTHHIRHKFLLGLMLMAALLSLVPTSVSAAGETAYLTPNSGLSQPGKTFTVSVDAYVGQSWWWWVPVGASSVEGSINFPASLLKVASINTAGTAFPNGSVTPNNSTGKIAFNGSTSSGSHMNKNVHLFSITFQSVAAGNASVTFGSVTYNIGTASTTGGTYTINSPPAPPPSPSPSPKPSPKPATPTKPKPSSTPVQTPAPSVAPTTEEIPEPVVESDGGLKVEGVRVTASRQENSVRWSLNKPAASPTFTYGTTKSNQTNKGEISDLGDGSYKVLLENLQLGTLYYFTIKASTSDNLLGASYGGVLTTRGYPVQLTISQNELLIPGAKVKIGERTFTANANGIVTAELGEGKYTAHITPPNSDVVESAEFVVKKVAFTDGSNPPLQSFTLNLSTVGSSTSHGSPVTPVLVIGAIGLLAALLGTAGFMIYRRKQNTLASTGVDTDLLTSSYGEGVIERRANTPEPNLLSPMPNFPPSSTAPPELQPLPASSEPPVPVLPANEPQQLVQPSEPSQLPEATSLETSAEPQSSEPVTEQQFNADAPAAAYQAVGDEAIPEQLSPELTKIESSEQLASEEPSAVYDASTGELDIIHHHKPVGGSSALSQGAPS